MVKYCPACNKDLPTESFFRNKSRKDGLQSVCKSCDAARYRARSPAKRKQYRKSVEARRRRMRAWWREFKQQFKCQRCPENHPACIQFHHPSGDKTKDISTQVPDSSPKRIKAEIEKCIPLCANCHAKEHWPAVGRKQIGSAGHQRAPDAVNVPSP